MEPQQNSPSRLLNVGEKAPSFSLPDQSQNVTTLDEFRGKKNVVLVFYPRDNTPGCTKQLCAYAMSFDLFTNHDIVVLASIRKIQRRTRDS